jgi:DUF3027 family protein
MRSRTPDRLCAEAVDIALAVTEEAAGPHSVGEHLGVVAEGDRVVTHLFACKEPAYRGWQWATTVTRASRAKAVTIDETVLLPGPRRPAAHRGGRPAPGAGLDRRHRHLRPRFGRGVRGG